MTITINLILLVLALILFLLSAVGVPSTRVNLQSAGLALLTLAFVLAHR